MAIVKLSPGIRECEDQHERTRLPKIRSVPDRNAQFGSEAIYVALDSKQFV